MALSAAEGVPLGDGEGAGGVADGEAVPVAVGVDVAVGMAALSPEMIKLSNRSVPPEPDAPAPIRRMEQLAALLHAEGSGPRAPIVAEDVHAPPALEVDTAVRPLAIKVPDEPVIEYSKLITLGPVLEWNMSKVKVMLLYPVVGTVNITPWGVVVYAVVE